MSTTSTQGLIPYQRRSLWPKFNSKDRIPNYRWWLHLWTPKNLNFRCPPSCFLLALVWTLLMDATIPRSRRKWNTPMNLWRVRASIYSILSPILKRVRDVSNPYTEEESDHLIDEVVAPRRRRSGLETAKRGHSQPRRHQETTSQGIEDRIKAHEAQIQKLNRDLKMRQLRHLWRANGSGVSRGVT